MTDQMVDQDDNRSPFGALLMALRLERGLTQEELAGRIGKAASTVSRYELSQQSVSYRRPSRPIVLALAQALDASADERDRLLKAANYAPEDPLSVLAHEPVVQAAVRLVLDDDVPEAMKDAVRADIRRALGVTRAGTT